MKPNIAALALALALMGCSNDITGPTPALPGEPGTDSAPTTPGFVCNEQLDTWVTVTGTGFSPLLEDAIADDADPSIVLPSVQLFLSQDLDGNAVQNAEPVIISGSEDADSLVRWDDGSTLRFRVTPELNLAAGVYGVVVVNPDGKRGVAPAAFAAVDRPVVTGIVDELACVDQSGRTAVVSGTGFLVRGETLPQVTVGDVVYEPTGAQGCTELPQVFGTWTTCTSLSIDIAQGDFEPGLFDVSVQNPAPAACGTLPDDAVQWTVVAPPAVADIQPEPTCSEQLSYEMSVTGTGFIRMGGDTPELPKVRIGAETYDATEARDCADIESLATLEAQLCTELIINVPAEDQPPGNQPVQVVNPQPAGCESTEAVDLTVVPPPRIDSVDPLPVCTAQSDTELNLRGADFLTVGDANPTALIDGEEYPAVASDCEPVEGPAVATQTCQSLLITVPAGSFPDGGAVEVAVRNPAPAACTTVETATLITVPPPTLTSLDANFACLETAPGSSTLYGEGLLRIGDAVPAVMVGGQAATVESLDDCTPLEGVDGVEVCRQASLLLPMGATEENLDVVATNPLPAGCVSDPIALRNFAPPTVDTAAPVLFCNGDGGTGMNLTGTGFYAVDGELPSMVVGQTVVVADSVDDCDTADDLSAEVRTCTMLTATLPADSAVPDVYEIAVLGAAPLACPQVDAGPQVVVAGAPAIESYEPPAVCRGQFDGVMTVRGTGFFEIDGESPTVTANGQPVQVTGSVDCVAVDTAPGVVACAGVDVLVPESLRDEDLLVALTNPAPADCETATIDVPLEEPPVIDDVQPRKICDAGGSLELTGDHFVDGMTVRLDGVDAETVEVHSPQSATATWAGPLTAGLATLEAQNPSGCMATFDTLIRVTEGPVVFYVDPPVLYNGVAIQVTVFLGNLYGGAVSEVMLTGPDDTVHPLEFTFDPQRPGRVQAIVPSGLTAGQYDVTLADDVDCLGTTEDLVLVTDQTLVALDAISPPFGWTSAVTGVTLTGPDPTPDDMVPFAPTPRAYINPSDAEPGDIATEIKALAFVNTRELTGIVPDGLPPGLYDVIVVNPDATVGVLNAGFTVTADPPPIVTGVNPGSWETNNDALEFRIDGRNFMESALTADCVDSAGNPLPAPSFAVGMISSQAIDATVDTTNLAHLSVCAIRVTNIDGSFDEFSPVTVTNPAGNFVAFRAGTAMETARRGPAMVGGAPARTTRILYALGGDDGTAGGALSSGEYTTLDRFGQPGAWSPLPGALPTPIAQTRAVRVRDFVYLPGGHDGDGATDAVWRAQILDPLYVPNIDSVDFDFPEDGEDGFLEGVYYYRISAVLAGDNAANPGGETLASEAQPLFVPSLDRALHIAIGWTPVADAAAYRIYRSVLPDAAAGQEELLAVVDGDQLTYTDDGLTAFEGGRPLPIGALGNWRRVATLSTPRYDHGVAVSADLDDPSVHHIVVAGGTDGVDLNPDVDIITVTVGGPRDQSVAVSTRADYLVEPRAGMEVVIADPINSSLLADPDVAFVYFLSGAGDGDITQVHFAPLMADGELGALGTTERLRPFRAHYVAAAANNTLVAVGGQGDAPSSTGQSSELAARNGTLDNWNSLGNTNLMARVRMGRAVFGGFLYIGGGTSPMDGATRAVEFSILGGVP